MVAKLVAAPELMVFLHLRLLERPSVDPEERYTVSRLAIPNCYRLVIRHGYIDEVVFPQPGFTGARKGPRPHHPHKGSEKDAQTLSSGAGGAGDRE
jgi:hypothetical protein